MKKDLPIARPHAKDQDALDFEHSLIVQKKGQDIQVKHLL